MRLPMNILSKEIVHALNFTSVVDDFGWVYMKVEKGMYGLKQAGIIVNQALVKHTAPYGHHSICHTHGLLVHDNRGKTFSLVVNDFCVQYTSQADVD